METFKEMVYQKDRCDGFVLADGVYKDHRYIVKSFGTHPTAYVQLNDNDPIYIGPLRHANDDQEELTYDDFLIECHGGLTYYADQLYVGNHDILPGHWVGWDYAHCEDYYGYDYDNPYYHTKKWTTKEMVDECKNVIDQVVEYNEKES